MAEKNLNSMSSKTRCSFRAGSRGADSFLLYCVAILALLGLGAGRGMAQEAAPKGAATKQIIFLAGPKDHAPAGRHEYEKDLRLLAECLENSPNLHGVSTKVYLGKAPQDISELKGAAAFVILSSSDARTNETHPLFPPSPTTDGRSYKGETAAYLNEFDKLVKAGAGVVVLHYAIQAQNWKARSYYMNWVGGLWTPEGYSQNPLGIWNISPVESSKQHPILRGVHPFTYADEIFCKFMGPMMDAKRTELVMATTTNSNQGAVGPTVASWAYQRDNGGRGFVYGGVDVHAAMQTEDYRRLLLNGIAWAAQMEIPEGGVQSSIRKDQ
ncbi:MAG: hypothetical protein JWN25_1293 [Verrucomicrobiales bacterium]|nr:hypothetical protein [Verrucomicrobiales bacterium]